MAKKTVSTENHNQDQAIDFETSRNYLILKSNSRAWTVALSSLFVTTLLSIAIIVMLPLKRVDLVVVKVDKNGFVEMVTDLNEQVFTPDEALDRHFIGRYVKTREQYFYNTLNQDYEKTQMFSSAIVAEKYVKDMINGKNSKYETLKNRFEIEAEILSIVLGDSNGTKTSTVRVQLNTKDLSSHSITKSIKVVTLTYKYVATLQQKAKARLENPLGFIVDSYRVDEEIIE